MMPNLGHIWNWTALECDQLLQYAKIGALTVVLAKLSKKKITVAEYP